MYLGIKEEFWSSTLVNLTKLLAPELSRTLEAISLREYAPP